MKTDVIVVSSNGSHMEEALAEVEKIAVYKELSPKNALHLRLLTEEMMGMMRSITGETEGQFWIEEEQNEYQLHLKVKTPMDSEKRSQLLAASSTGKNESAKGLMGRIRDFFERGTDEDVLSFSSALVQPDSYDYASSSPLDWEWSMIRYEESLSRRIGEDDTEAREAWDELEKSVVSHVADDIKVSIRGRDVEMTIIKKLA